MFSSMRFLDRGTAVRRLDGNAVAQGFQGYDQTQGQYRNEENILHDGCPTFIAPEITSVSKHYDCPWGPDASDELHKT